MKGPGLAKVRSSPVLFSREAVLVRPGRGRWRTSSSGPTSSAKAARATSLRGRVWYGTTSLILLTDGIDTELLATLAGRDVHVRLRALRVARREACLRAPAASGAWVVKSKSSPIREG